MAVLPYPGLYYWNDLLETQECFVVSGPERLSIARLHEGEWEVVWTANGDDLEALEAHFAAWLAYDPARRAIDDLRAAVGADVEEAEGRKVEMSTEGWSVNDWMEAAPKGVQKLVSAYEEDDESVEFTEAEQEDIRRVFLFLHSLAAQILRAEDPKIHSMELRESLARWMELGRWHAAQEPEFVVLDRTGGEAE